MRKHLLVTVSEDVSALYGVRFTASFIQSKDLVAVSYTHLTLPTIYSV